MRGRGEEGKRGRGDSYRQQAEKFSEQKFNFFLIFKNFCRGQNHPHYSSLVFSTQDSSKVRVIKLSIRPCTHTHTDTAVYTSTIQRYIIDLCATDKYGHMSFTMPTSRTLGLLIRKLILWYLYSRIEERTIKKLTP